MEGRDTPNRAQGDDNLMDVVEDSDAISDSGSSVPSKKPRQKSNSSHKLKLKNWPSWAAYYMKTLRLREQKKGPWAREDILESDVFRAIIKEMRKKRRLRRLCGYKPPVHAPRREGYWLSDEYKKNTVIARSASNSPDLPDSSPQGSGNSKKNVEGNAEITYNGVSLETLLKKWDVKGKIRLSKKGTGVHPSTTKSGMITTWYRRASKVDKYTMQFIMGRVGKRFLAQSQDHMEVIELERDPDAINLVSIRNLKRLEEKLESEPFPGRVQNPEYDEELFNELQEKKSNEAYIEMARKRAELPVSKMAKEIVEMIKNSPVTVISGGTGCGKTTQIVQFVLDDYIMNKKGSMCNIVCAQPRRLTTKSVAERVAEERAEELGQSVGYSMRLDSRATKRKFGCINYMTTGTLLHQFTHSPLIPDITHIFIDEIHERATEAEFLMALLKKIIPKRPDLKIVLMSATVRSNDFADYFGGAPSLDIPSLSFPVGEYYLDDILCFCYYFFPRKNKKMDPNQCSDFFGNIVPYIPRLKKEKSLSQRVVNELCKPSTEMINHKFVARVIYYILHTLEKGAILVFVPGMKDMKMLQYSIMKNRWYKSYKMMIMLVHSRLPTDERIFKPAPPGIRKIIISTSIMETGVTVEDLVYVIDTGKTTVTRMDLGGRTIALEKSWASMANVWQRRGRVGRLAPGKCFKLYTKLREKRFSNYPKPSIQCQQLEQVILQAKGLNIRYVKDFFETMMDPPPKENVDIAMTALLKMRVLDNSEIFTPFGYCLSALPLDPLAGKMVLIGAVFSCFDPILSIVACLSYKDPFIIPAGCENKLRTFKHRIDVELYSDHIVYSKIVKLWENQDPEKRQEFCEHNFLSNDAMMHISKVKAEIASILHKMGFMPSPDYKDPRSNFHSDSLEVIKAVICAGLYPNVAKITKFSASGCLCTSLDDIELSLSSRSVIRDFNYFQKNPFLVYHSKLKACTRFITDGTIVHPLSLLLFGERFDVIPYKSRFLIEVDDFLTYKVSENVARCLKYMRKKLNEVMDAAWERGEVVNWDNWSGSTEILMRVVCLIKDANSRIRACSNYKYQNH